MSDITKCKDCYFCGLLIMQRNGGFDYSTELYCCDMLRRTEDGAILQVLADDVCEVFTKKGKEK